MIELPSQVGISIFSSESGFVVVTHYDEEYGRESTLVMTKARAIELSKALKQVAGEVE